MYVSVSEFVELVAYRTKFSLTDLLGGSRRKPICRARQVMMFVLRRKVKKSYPQIGMAFNRMDHTSCIHAVRTVERLLRQRDPYTIAMYRTVIRCLLTARNAEVARRYSIKHAVTGLIASAASAQPAYLAAIVADVRAEELRYEQLLA